jgi:hypothetical protein
MLWQSAPWHSMDVVDLRCFLLLLPCGPVVCRAWWLEGFLKGHVLPLLSMH